MMERPLKLDLGCGRRGHPGAIGMDNVLLDTVDLLHDLNSIPYPFMSGCADEVIFSHVLEHFEFPDIVRILDEAHRILKPGGLVTISVPHAFSVAAFAPQHRTYFCFEYFEMFDPAHPFGYYADFAKPWKVIRRWASTNLINNHVDANLAQNPIVMKTEYWIGKFISLFARGGNALSIADFLVRVLPLWLVSIHWQLQKPID